MKQYKTLESWEGYAKGAIVPNDVAEQFLEKYLCFEDQSILEIVEGKNEEAVEKAKEEVEVPKKVVKKSVKKSRKA